MSLPLKDAQINGFAKSFNNHFTMKHTAEIEETLLKTIKESAQQFLAEHLANSLACCDTQTTDAYTATADAYTAAAGIYKAAGDNNAARQFYKKAGESYTAVMCVYKVNRLNFFYYYY